MFIKSLVAAVMLLNAPQNGPKVTAVLSSSMVTVGEPFTYQVIIENADDDVDIPNPSFPDGIQVVGSQDYSEMQFSVPGGRRMVRRREIALVASRPGRYRFPSLVVQIGRKAFRTPVLEANVSGAPQSRSVESSGGAWLRATMSPDTVYVGQQSTLTVEAGFSDEVRQRLTRPPSFEAPSPNGFWVQDVPGGPTSQLRAVNGRVLEVHRLQRAYFGLSPGRFAFAPARALIDIREGFLFAPETREIRSQSPKLTVLPLPTSGQPRDFKGAVGNFTVRAIVQPDTVAVGEAAQITVEITGIGNIKAIPQPVMPTLNGVEEFAPTEDATVTFDGSTQHGVKHFQWVVIPQRAGRISVPPISYSFFDPIARKYKTVQTEPAVLIATSVPRASATDAAVVLRDIGNKPRRVSSFAHSRWFLLLQLLPLLAIAAAWYEVNRRKNSDAGETSQQAIARLRTHGGSYDEFLRELERVVRRCGQGPDADALLDRIARQRFAPAAAEAAEREDLLNQAEKVCRA